MPRFADSTEEDLQSLLDEGGVKKDTQKRRKRILGWFETEISRRNLILGEIIPSKELLDGAVMKFLEDFRVPDPKNKEEMIRPKANYFNFIRSCLKTELSEMSGFDLGNKADFPKLNKATNSILSRIKEAGRAETSHHEALPDETMYCIMRLCGTLQQVLEARLAKNKAKYDEALSMVPVEYWDNYNELLRICIQFLITLLDIRRGNEGIELLTKDHFEIVVKNGIKMFQKVNFYRQCFRQRFGNASEFDKNDFLIILCLFLDQRREN